VQFWRPEAKCCNSVTTSVRKKAIRICFGARIFKKACFVSESVVTELQHFLD